MQIFNKKRCYFGQNLKRKGSISPSNFDSQLPNILFTYLCLSKRVYRVVAEAQLQIARGVHYFLVLWDYKFYAKRRSFLNI